MDIFNVIWTLRTRQASWRTVKHLGGWESFYESGEDKKKLEITKTCQGTSVHFLMRLFGEQKVAIVAVDNTHI